MKTAREYAEAATRSCHVEPAVCGPGLRDSHGACIIGIERAVRDAIADAKREAYEEALAAPAMILRGRRYIEANAIVELLQRALASSGRPTDKGQ